MIADAIRLVLTNLPLLLFIAALIVAAQRRTPKDAALRYLSWLLLLSVGVESLWGGAAHVFFPATAAAAIGWQVSPFQFEIGVADLSLGVVAVLSFWRGLAFKAAVVGYTALFYLGVAIGHLRQAFVAGDYSPDNFGILLGLTVIKMVLLPLLLHRARAGD